jgi:hypothetical protein
MSAGTLVVETTPIDPRTIRDESFRLQRCDDGPLRAIATVRAHGIKAEVSSPVKALDAVTVLETRARLLSVATQALDTYVGMHELLPAPLRVELGRGVVS